MAAPYTLMGWLSGPCSPQNAARASSVRIQGHGCIALEGSSPGARALPPETLEIARGGGLAAMAAPPGATLAGFPGNSLHALCEAAAAQPVLRALDANAEQARAQPKSAPRSVARTPVPSPKAARTAGVAPPVHHLSAVPAAPPVPSRNAHLPQPTGSNWSILAVVASLVAVVFVGALFASVEVTVKAPGALRAPEGLRPVESAIAGAIANLEVRAGDEVSAGQLIAKLAVAQLDASLTSKRQELEAVKHQNALGEATDKAYSERIDTALRHRRQVLQSRARLNQELRAQRRDTLDRTRELVREGAGSRIRRCCCGCERPWWRGSPISWDGSSCASR